MARAGAELADVTLPQAVVWPLQFIRLTDRSAAEQTGNEQAEVVVVVVGLDVFRADPHAERDQGASDEQQQRWIGGV